MIETPEPDYQIAFPLDTRARDYELVIVSLVEGVSDHLQGPFGIEKKFKFWNAVKTGARTVWEQKPQRIENKYRFRFTHLLADSDNEPLTWTRKSDMAACAVALSKAGSKVAASDGPVLAISAQLEIAGGYPRFSPGTLRSVLESTSPELPGESAQDKKNREQISFDNRASLRVKWEAAKKVPLVHALLLVEEDARLLAEQWERKEEWLPHEEPLPEPNPIKVNLHEFVRRRRTEVRPNGVPFLVGLQRNQLKDVAALVNAPMHYFLDPAEMQRIVRMAKLRQVGSRFLWPMLMVVLLLAGVGLSQKSKHNDALLEKHSEAARQMTENAEYERAIAHLARAFELADTPSMKLRHIERRASDAAAHIRVAAPANILSARPNQDLRRLATSHADGSVTIWDAQTGQSFASRSGFPGDITVVSFTSDNAHLVLVSESEHAFFVVSSLNLETSKKIDLPGTKQPMRLVPALDGSRFLAVTDQILWLLGSDGEILGTQECISGWSTYAIQRNGSETALLCHESPDRGNVLRVWDREGKKNAELNLGEGPAECIQLRGPRLTVVMHDGRVIDGRTAQETQGSRAHKYQRIACGSGDEYPIALGREANGNTEIWDLRTGEMLQAFRVEDVGRFGEGWSAARNGGLLALDVGDRESLLWAPGWNMARRIAWPVSTFSGSGSTGMLTFEGNEARIWIFERGGAWSLKDMVGESDMSDLWMAFSDDGNRVLGFVGMKDRAVDLVIWDSLTGNVLGRRELVTVPHQAYYVSTDSKAHWVFLQGAFADESPRVWNVTNGSESAFPDASGPAHLSADGQYLLANSRVWDLESRVVVWEMPSVGDWWIEDPLDEWKTVFLSGDDELDFRMNVSSGGVDKTDTTERLLLETDPSSKWILAKSPYLTRIFSLSTDANRVALEFDSRASCWSEYPRFEGDFLVECIFLNFQDRAIRIRENEEGGWRTKAEFNVGSPVVQSLAIADNGNTVLIGTRSNALLVRKANENEPERSYLPHASNVDSVSFSADETLILTGTAKGRWYLWDSESGQPLEGYGEARAASFAAAGGELRLIRDNGRIDRFDVSVDDMLSADDVLLHSKCFSPFEIVDEQLVRRSEPEPPAHICNARALELKLHFP